MRAAAICPHNLLEDECLTCAFANLRDVLSDVQDKVTAARGSAVRDTFVAGGNPSWEPLNLAALSLLQDIVRQGSALVLGRRRDGDNEANDVLWSLERQCQRFGEDALTGRIRRRLADWQRRADTILDRAKAPWPLPTAVTYFDQHGIKRHTTKPTGCPVLSPELERCTGHLMVHPANELRARWGESASITCSRSKSHTWSKSKGGWVLLSALLKRSEQVAS